MTIIKKLDFSPQGNNTLLISSASMQILHDVFNDYKTMANNQFHTLNLILLSIPHDFDGKIKETLFMLAPASSASELNYILYCPEKNTALPPNIKKVEYYLSVDKQSGIATLEKLKQPKIIKTINIEMDSDDELSNSDCDWDEDANLDQYKGFESTEHQCSPAHETSEELIQTPVRELYDSDLESSFNLTEAEFNSFRVDSFDSTDGDDRDWSESDDDSSENDAQPINQGRFYQDNFSDGPESESGDEEKNSSIIHYNRYIKKTPPKNLMYKNNTNASKNTFFQVPSDSRRELACRKKIYPNENNLQIIATKEKCVIVDDFVEGKTLHDILKDMHKNPIDYSNQRILNLVKLSIQAMHFVHSRGVIHGDLNPENIIISPNETTARVIDFGGSVVIPEDDLLLRKKVKACTLHYVPPEQQHEVSDVILTATETLDLNAAALIVVILCTGYGYDDCGLNERRLNYNLFRNKEKQYDSYITKLSDHIKFDVNNPHDLELQKDLNKIASTISSFGTTGSKLQALFDRVLAEIPEKRGDFTQLFDEVTQIEKNYEDPLRARRLSI